MNEFKYAFRRFFKGRSLNIIKVISLGLGFTISFLLLSKVAHELSYDSFVKDVDRVYMITSWSKMGENDPMSFNSISGGVAPGMMVEIPQVEIATRWTGFVEENKLFLKDKRGIKFEGAILADEYIFDIFTTQIITGDPKKVLTEQMQCMISDHLAEKIGNDVIGMQFEFKDYPGILLTISGVFKKHPNNSTLHCDVLVSLPSIGKFTWDGSENWFGNDRYAGFVKLTKGSKPEDIKDAIYKVQQKYQDIDRIQKEYNATVSYILKPLRSLHLSDSIISTTLFLMGIVGLVVLLMSLFNYLLLRITSIINSSKNTAIRKSLGGEKRDIMKGIIADTIIHLFFALLIGILFLLVFRKAFGEILEISLKDLLNPTSILIAVGLLLISGLFISIGPGKLVANQSLINTIQNHHKTNRRWKLVLLFIEGMGVSFLLATVFFVQKQYHHFINIDKGYDVQNVYHVFTSSLDSIGIKNVTERLRNSPLVESASLAFTTPYAPGQSGDNLFDGETGKELRNVSDYFWCDKYYLDLFRIPIVEGEGFDTAVCHSKHAIVNENFANHLIQDFGWTDGVIGKEINITSHTNPMTIIGVMANFRTNRFGQTFKTDESIVIAGGAWYRYCGVMLVRLVDSKPATIKAVEDIINEHSTFGDIELGSAESAVLDLYKKINNLGNITIFGSIIAIIISFIGIIGYTEEEVTRRRKEIAIRKVNGASFGDILKLFIVRYLKIGIPSVLLGLACAFIAINKWVETLSDQIALPVPAFFLIGLVVLAVTCLIMAIYCYFTANQNPTKYLAEE